MSLKSKMDRVLKERVDRIDLLYSATSLYQVTLKPEFRFNSKTALHKMVFDNKQEATAAVYHAVENNMAAA